MQMYNHTLFCLYQIFSLANSMEHASYGHPVSIKCVDVVLYFVDTGFNPIL